MNSKNVWVVTDSEPIPQLTGTGRLMRGGKFAEYFANEGCKVTWWTTTFLHYEKRFIYNESKTVELSDNIKINFLHPIKAYKKHVSIDRILFAAKMGKLLGRAINRESEKPDLIFCSWPGIEQAYECVKYGKRYDIPVVIDIRDMWPDIFVQPFPKKLQPVAMNIVKLIYGKKVSYALKNATQVIGISDDYLAMAVRWGRKDKEIDFPVLQCYKESKYKEEEIEGAESYWRGLGISEKDFIIIYIGSIHLRNAKLDMLIDAAKRIKGSSIKFVLCGDGPDYNKLVEETLEYNNIIFPGYKNDVQLYVLGKMSSVGILPYSNTPDFINALPSKFGEYLYYQLILLSTLSGYSKELIEEYECGEYFENVDGLVNLINKYYSSKELAEESKKNSERLYNDKLNADKVYTKYCKDLLSR